MLLKCPSCERTYKSAPEDNYLELSQSDSSSLREKIFFGRYGTDTDGRHVDYVLCCGCSKVSCVVPSVGIKLPLALFGLAFPYKPYNLPIDLFKVHYDVNVHFDVTGKDLESIFNEGFILPSHIFRVLLRLKIFEIGELGLLMYGRNTYASEDDSVMSFGNYVSAVKNDINYRKKEIEENLK
jgi:hypothetical protein